MLFAGLLLIKVSEREFLAQRVHSARDLIQVLAQGVAEQVSAGGADSVPRDRVGRLFAALPDSAGIDNWLLVDRELQSLTGGGKLRSLPEGTPAFESRIRFAREPLLELRYPVTWLPFAEPGESFLTVSMPIRSHNRFLGALQIRFSLDPVRRQVEKTQKLFLLYVVLYGLVLVLFGAYLLGRTVVGPVRRLLGATREVTGGTLDHALAVEGPREIAELAGSFNVMLDVLRDSRGQTEEHIRTLEETNATLRETRQELLRAERMASVGHLAAGMAHEVGNPLAAMIGYLEYLRGELPAPDQRDLVERTLAEAARIDNLVRDLLDFAAPPSRDLERAEPGQVIEEARMLLERQGRFEGLDLRLEVAAGLPVVRMDPHRLLQVLVNLLLNACDATPAGGTIRIVARDLAEGVRLEVADSGSGMSEELQRHVFDPFFSTKPEGQGRGLGLAICHRLVDEAGGRIEIHSTPGKGSSFRLTLPVGGGQDGDS